MLAVPKNPALFVNCSAMSRSQTACNIRTSYVHPMSCHEWAIAFLHVDWKSVNKRVIYPYGNALPYSFKLKKTQYVIVAKFHLPRVGALNETDYLITRNPIH